MKILYPDYCKRFACLAGACPESCCKAWEICIDPDTVSFYRGVEGALGERLRTSLAVDAEGDVYFPLKDGRCPFLDRRGLCEIHAQLGEQATSAVCRQYPYFIEEYDGFTEKCPSLSCPAAAELIFSEELGGGVYPMPPMTADPFLDFLVKGRTAALETAGDNLPFSGCVSRIWGMAQRMQEVYEGLDDEACFEDIFSFDYVQQERDICTESVRILQTDRYLRLLSEEAEILTEEWRDWLESTLARGYASGMESDQEPDSTVRRCLRYFLYRYFLKPVNDGDILSWTAFILLSVAACVRISDCISVDFRIVARRYSKEIEHDPDNLDLILAYLKL